MTKSQNSNMIDLIKKIQGQHSETSGETPYWREQTPSPWTTTTSDKTNGLWDCKPDLSRRQAEREREVNKAAYVRLQDMMQKMFNTPIMCPICENNPGKGKANCDICCGSGVSPCPASEVRHKVNAY